MSETLEFKVFCIEAYKNYHHLSGREAAALFRKYRVLEYLDACYDALHTTGKNYIIEDIDLYISARKA